MGFLKTVILITTFFLISFCYPQYQNNDNELRDYFSAILYLTDRASETKQINGQQYEVLYRKPWTEEIIERKTPALGSGFFLIRGLDVYLITAEHVARFLKSKSEVKYLNIDGLKKETTIQDLTPDKTDLKKLNWIRHPKADIAILHLGIYDNVVKDIGMLDYEFLAEALKAPNRLNDLTIMGYPLGLGVTPLSISPITRNTRSASDIVYFGRFDNGVINPFIVTDDPSIGGFSGGPVLEIRKAGNGKSIQGEKVKVSPTLIGLVHGNLASNTPGNFAAIVPAFQILETIKLAPKYNGEYTFYYPDGKVWSKRIYKDGLPWNILSNYNIKGEPQEKGTLKDGEGQILVWNKKSTRAEVIFCSKGKCSGGVYMFVNDDYQN